jgi:hypothetical protein
MLARADLKDRRFFLGPWLESMHPGTLAHLLEDLERDARGAAQVNVAEALLLVVMAIIARELPGGEYVAERTIAEAFSRLYAYANLERDRRGGLVAIEGVPALSSDDGVTVVALEGLEQALAAGAQETGV